jgi:hypothetical protein
MQPILIGKVLWSFDEEVLDRDLFHELGAHFTGVLPFHRHSGEIALTKDALIIVGDNDLEIPLSNVKQVYLGFDDIFPRTLLKNFGFFWQPLRISLSTGQSLYLIIDYTILGAKNQLWFNELQEVLTR